LYVSKKSLDRQSVSRSLSATDTKNFSFKETDVKNLDLSVRKRSQSVTTSVSSSLSPNSDRLLKSSFRKCKSSLQKQVSFDKSITGNKNKYHSNKEDISTCKN
jgi:hypothetical protein